MAVLFLMLSQEAADLQAEWRAAWIISDFRNPRTISLAKRSRSIHSCQQRTLLGSPIALGADSLADGHVRLAGMKGARARQGPRGTVETAGQDRRRDHDPAGEPCDLLSLGLALQCYDVEHRQQRVWLKVRWSWQQLGDQQIGAARQRALQPPILFVQGLSLEIHLGHELVLLA